MTVFVPRKISCLILAGLMSVLALPQAAAQWNVQSSGSSGDIYEVHFNDESTGTAAVWVKPGAAEILTTDNGGVTWTKSLSEINQGMTGVRTLGPRKAVVIGGTTNFSRVFTTDDAGDNWALRVDDASSTPAFWAVDFVGARDGYVAGGQGYFMSTTDGGGSWTAGASVPGGTHVLDLDFIDLRNGYAVTSPSEQNYWSGARLYRTTDAGFSWELVTQFPQINAVEFVDENIGYVAGGTSAATIWKTTDGGATWTTSYMASSAGQTFMDICVAPDNPFVLYAVGGNLFDENNPIIVRSIDGGFSWQSEDAPGGALLRSVHFPTETEGFACGTDGTILQTSRDPSPAPEPHAEIEPTELLFGEHGVGEGFSIPVNIQSVSAAALEIKRIEFEEADAAERGFTLDIVGELPLTVDGGDFFAFYVDFQAQAAGEQQVTLIIETNDVDGAVVNIPVSGSGAVELEPGLVLDKTSLEFGELDAGDSKSLPLQLLAANEADLELQALEIEGDAFSLADSPFMPIMLDDENELEILIAFEPQAAGEYTGELVITTSAGEERVALSGSAVEEPTGIAILPRGGVFKVEIGPNPRRAGEQLTAHVDVPRDGMLYVELISLRGTTVTMPPSAVQTGSVQLPLELPAHDGAAALLRFRFESTQVTVPILTTP